MRLSGISRGTNSALNFANDIFVFNEVNGILGLQEDIGETRRVVLTQWGTCSRSSDRFRG